MNKTKQKNKPELLCPVGSQLALRAAVENGADAVYLGMDKYSARTLAENFTIDNIKETLNYCHLRGVKVYVALNTILLDNEIKEALELAKDLYMLGADAFIVQDIGLLHILSKIMPDMPIHISTQATIYSTEGIKALEKYNIKRVVLARETTLEEIKNIKKESKIPVEIFVHGALCTSYSGQCLMSSYIGSRSGNRGNCAQPCRLKYDILESNNKLEYKEVVKEKYCISTKDLYLLENLPDLISVGVDSFKIEGRMKAPEYVGIVTKIYRKYIDMAISNEEYIIDENDKKKLLQIFSRGGFTKGYLENESPTEIIYNELPKHTGIYIGTVIEYIKEKNNIIIKLEEPLNMGDGVEVRNKYLPGAVVSFIRKGKERVIEANIGNTVTIGDIKGNVFIGDKVYKISNKKMNEEISSTYIHNKNIKKIDIDAIASLKIGEPFKLQLKYKDFSISAVSENLCEKGITKSLSKEDIINNISKFGDTSFNISKINVDMDEGVIISTSQINSVRREAAAKLEQAICDEYTRNKIDKNIKAKKDQENTIVNKNKIAVYLYNLDNTEGLEKVDKIYLPFDKLIQNKNILDNILNSYLKEKDIYIDLGNISKGETNKKILENIDMIQKVGNILVGNIEQLDLLKKADLNIELESSLNTYNSYSIEAFKEMGIDKLSLSNELSTDEVSKINNLGAELSLSIYGKIPLMTMQSCIIANNVSKKTHCNLCSNNKYYLKDRVGDIYPISTNILDCRNTILSSNNLFDLEKISKLKHIITTFRLYFLDENKVDRINIIEKIKERLV